MADLSQFKRTEAKAPVSITEHGEPSQVLGAHVEYERLRGTPEDTASWLAMGDDLDFEVEPLGLDMRPVEL